MIEFQHVSKHFGHVQAVNDVSFSASGGQVIGLLGVNGAGKSTILNMMTGCMPPSSGCVRIDGMDMFRSGSACRRKLGYLPEQSPLYPEMTVQEYLTFVCRLREVQKTAIPGHVQEIMHLCGLEDVRNRLLGQLSRGYGQRAGIAQALCGTPEVLVLDEPTVGLDPRQVVEIRQLIHALGSTHTVIFSTHVLSEAQALCSRVLIVHHGRLVSDVSLTGETGRRTVHVFSACIAGNREQVLPAVRSLPSVIRVSEEPGSRDGQVLISLETSDEDEGMNLRKALFRLLGAMDTPLLLLEKKRHLLEDLFLKATKEDMEE